MKSVFRICLLFLLILGGLPLEATACCSESTVQQCEMDQDLLDNTCDNNACDDSSCHCICCGTISMVCSNQVLGISSLKDNIHTVPKTYTSLFDHLFTNSIWQPPKENISSSIL